MVLVYESIISRFQVNKNPEKEDKIRNSDQIGSNPFCIFEPNRNQEEAKSEIYQVFPSYENFHDCCSEDEDKVSKEEFIISDSKYEFSSGKHISGFFEQPKILRFTVHQGFVSFDNYPPCNMPIFENLVAADDDFERKELESSFSVCKFVTERVLEVTKREIKADPVREPIAENFFGDEMDSDRQQWETTTQRESSNQILVDADLGQDLENTEEENSDDACKELEPRSQKYSTPDKKISSRVYSGTKPEKVVDDEPSLEEKQSKSKFNEDSNPEPMLEHDDIIEQLKMEIKIAKAAARKGGLPTISEDSESDYLKILPELKPMKIDQKVDHKYRIAEIHKIYKSYADKMRKLDVLNLQTIHATGFAQQKASMQLTSTRKSAVLSRLCKQRRPKAVQPMNCSAILKNDFELVYVGQLCLSWEILHWQYKKALEFREYDPHGLCHYNQVAGEFQLFHVLMQRFLENEPFQGQPRIENYVASRYVQRNLLQVPVIIDDASRDKKLEKGGEEHFISISNLTDMIGETLQLFWQFLSADSVVVNGPHHRASANLQNPADFELLMEIRNDLQKKEKKLKEIVRCGSCIVKRLKKHEGDGLMLFAQVELRLISRVLSMSKLTRDYLVWCHGKLYKINFCNGTIGIEPSFLLFPC